MPSARSLSRKAEALLSVLANSRASTDHLFRVVKTPFLYDRPIPERHRIVFYLGHLEAFDWNLIGKYVLNLGPFEEGLDRLFAFGIDPVGGGLPTDKPSDWPKISAVEKYNQKVRATLDAALERTTFDDRSLPLLRDGYILNVAIEHRLMHAETLAYMLHQMPLERKVGEPSARLSAVQRHEPRMIDIPAGTATLGLARDEQGPFGWDNEYQAHTVSVLAFAIDAHKVTNGQFLKFMEAGGYEDASLWEGDAWNWIKTERIRHPVLWISKGNQWVCRSMFDEIPLPLAWPVYVSHAEASAYAKWAGKALPTEAQWHRAALGTPQGVERSYPWGDEPPAAEHGNFDFHRWDPTPVGSFPSGDSAFGVAEMVGNGWEWTSTRFEPFPGFEAFPFYPGYSANFFDGRHYVMKGGSARTAACMLRRSFRNWFQGRYQYPYAGFRCVAN
ncbi:MAG: SUMF1/EgtB/PvdO family nonheme iron enzyme [Terriglobia bacterium]